MTDSYKYQISSGRKWKNETLTTDIMYGVMEKGRQTSALMMNRTQANPVLDVDDIQNLDSSSISIHNPHKEYISEGR